MFKKALILCLAICMLSVNVFAGTQMLSLSTDYTDLSGPTMPAETTATPEVVRVVESESAGTQTVYYWDADNLPDDQLKSNTMNGTASYEAKFKAWHYMKVPTNGLTAVNAATVSAQLRFNTGKTTFYIRPLEKSVWDAAVANLADGSNKTISSDLFAMPSGDALWSTYSEGTASLATFNDISSDALTAYMNEGAAEGYIYLAVSAQSWRADKDGGATVLSSWAFSLDGAKPVEGVSASIVATKTDTIYFTNADNIAYLKKGSEGNQYTSAGNYKVTTYKGTYNSVDYDLDNILYLKADLSAYMDKEIESIEFVSRHRENKGANTIYVGQTETDWASETISYESKPASLSSGILFGGGTSWNEASISVKPFLSNIGDDGILSLSISANVGATTTNFYGAEIYGVGKSDAGLSPHLVITYKDAVGSDGTVTDKFTYQAEIATEGATAYLVVGIYNNQGALIDVITSGVLTSNGTDPLTMDIDLTSYEGVASISAFMWNGTTLVPYFTPITRTATVTVAV